MKHSEIYNGDELIATADIPASYSLGPMGDIERIGLFYFPKIRLTPTIAFEHLAGTSLSKWLNGCVLYLHEDGGESNGCGPLRYVHGHSEVLKGKHTISSVLLADPVFKKEVPFTQWLTMLPDIYRQFMTTFRNG